MQNQNVKAISDYLEAICNKLNKEFTSEQQQSQPQSIQNRTLNQSQLTPQLNNQDTQQNIQTNMDNGDNIESAENENSQLGNDDESVQINDDQSGNVSNQNSAMNVDNEIGKVNGTEKLTETTQMEVTPEKKRKIEPVIIVVEKKTTKDDFDSELITLISEHTTTVKEWKEIAVQLKMDEDTISFIESEPSDVKEQTKKILQLWKVE